MVTVSPEALITNSPFEIKISPNIGWFNHCGLFFEPIRDIAQWALFGCNLL
jgi:hypothetical protein